MEAHFVQRGAGETEYLRARSASPTAPDPLQKGGDRRRWADKHDVVDAANVDAEFECRRAHTNGDRGRSKTILHLTA
ncbi:MAG: hypothetical protein R2867_23095 [Caldilineaceae bacterium]